MTNGEVFLQSAAWLMIASFMAAMMCLIMELVESSLVRTERKVKVLYRKALHRHRKK